MAIAVTTETVQPRRLAAVRRKVTIGQVGSAWKPALDKVWAFLREHPGVRTDGHNIFLYHHPARRTDAMEVDFGVEVARDFEPAGEVARAVTPAGEVAKAVHVGSYDRMAETHDAVHAWARQQGRSFAGQSWEIYGDPPPDPAKMEITIMYLLEPAT